MLAVPSGPVGRFRNAVFDGWQRAMPRERVADLVVVVAIDEKALATWGQWPWPRTRVAELVSRIAAAKPLALGLDIYFPEADRFSPGAIADQLAQTEPELAERLRGLESNDRVLGKALAKVPSVLAVAGIDLPDARYAGPPGGPPFRFAGGAEAGIRHYAGHLHNIPLVDAGAVSHGLVNSDFEGGVARSVPVVATVGGHAVLGLGVELVRTGLGQLAQLRPGAGGLVEVQFGDYVVPAQRDGRAYLRYGHSNPGRFIPVSEILADRFDMRQLEGKLVLLGYAGIGLQDLTVTPLGEHVHGIEVHAQVAEAIVEEQFLRRPAYAGPLEVALLALFGLALVVLTPRWTAQRSSLLLVGGVLVLVGAGAAAFRYGGLLFDPAAPALAAALVFGALQAVSLAESQRQQRRLREQAARVAGELHAAKRIQMGLLPDAGKVAGPGSSLDLAALIEPARSVGGDFYDCFMLDERRLYFAVGDVSGKGLPASLFMASVRNVLKTAALSSQGRLGRLLTSAQSEMRKENPEFLFVTALLGVLDVKTGHLEYVSAGHEPAWHRAPGGTPERVQGRSGPPLGVMDEDFLYPVSRHSLKPGEWLLVITDGVTEATNQAGDFFGAERVQAFLATLGDGVTAAAIITSLRDAVNRFEAGTEPADDLTLLAVRWAGPEATVRAPA